MLYQETEKKKILYIDKGVHSTRDVNSRKFVHTRTEAPKYIKQILLDIEARDQQ